jgi:hypothetical protein
MPIDLVEAFLLYPAARSVFDRLPVTTQWQYVAFVANGPVDATRSRALQALAMLAERVPYP